jgi:hypothetical protein
LFREKDSIVNQARSVVAAEDVHHLLFSCPVAEEIWKELRLDSIINEVVGEDRSGSVVLEILLRQPASSMPNMPQIRVQELIGVTCWGNVSPENASVSANLQMRAIAIGSATSGQISSYPSATVHFVQNPYRSIPLSP